MGLAKRARLAVYFEAREMLEQGVAELPAAEALVLLQRCGLDVCERLRPAWLSPISPLHGLALGTAKNEEIEAYHTIIRAEIEAYRAIIRAAVGGDDGAEQASAAGAALLL
jgi:hypothetical protein